LGRVLQPPVAPAGGLFYGPSAGGPWERMARVRIARVRSSLPVFLVSDPIRLFMSFSVESLSSNTVVIRMGEALDFRNADEFKETFRAQIEDDVRNFVLDFSETAVLDSTGLGSIFSLYRQISPDDGQVAFADVSRPVQVVVQLTRTYKVFRQFPTVRAAEDALASE
jgi:anti-sigma B factor antagonist